VSFYLGEGINRCLSRQRNLLHICFTIAGMVKSCSNFRWHKGIDKYAASLHDRAWPECCDACCGHVSLVRHPHRANRMSSTKMNQPICEFHHVGAVPWTVGIIETVLYTCSASASAAGFEPLVRVDSVWRQRISELTLGKFLVWKSAAHRDNSREWNVSKQKWKLR